MADLLYLLPLYLGYAVLFHIAWMRSEKFQNATHVDALWALGIAFGAAIHAKFSGGEHLRQFVVLAAVSFWSLRLAWHLYSDRVKAGVEDARYRKLRLDWAEKARFKFWFVFQVQALLSFAFALVTLPSLGSTRPFGDLWDWMGVAVFMIALLGEWLADHQLKTFKSKPESKGKTLQSGLWKYSRHPNYFFEWVHWFAYVFWSFGSGMEQLALGGPILMLWFLMKVTGIPAAEASSLRSRGEEYREYQRRTSSFFPWFPKEK